MDVTGTGASFGTIAIIGGIIAAIGAIYYLSTQKKQKPRKKLLSDENRYKGYKEVIEDAIRDGDWQTLEDMLKSKATDFTDLIDMINSALSKRQK